jgi:hypothetical protein
MKIGITGHQNLGSISNFHEIANILKQIVSEYPITLGYTCLAKGSDQLFAEILLEIGIPYVAVIPSDRYENTFTEKGTFEKYKVLLQHANRKTLLPFAQPEEKAFYEAGKYVADSVDLLIAIWNGEDAKGLGGTGDIVKYCLSLKKEVVHLNSISLKINYL